jgi:hypothetical protein
MKLSSKVAASYLIMSFPVVVKGYIGTLIGFAIVLSVNYLRILGFHASCVYSLSDTLSMLFNPPLYIAINYGFQLSGYVLAFSFVYPFLLVFLLYRVLNRT